MYLYTQVIVWVNLILQHIEMRGDFTQVYITIPGR